MKSDFIGELGDYNIYRYKGHYVALEKETRKIVVTGDTYEEVFDEVSYIMTEKEAFREIANYFIGSGKNEN